MLISFSQKRLNQTTYELHHEWHIAKNNLVPPPLQKKKIKKNYSQTSVAVTAKVHNAVPVLL